MAYIYALLSLLGGWIGSATGTFFNKKLENLATKQDIAEITRITRDIEARISNEVWVSQRNWQARRDVAYELAREAASFQESVIGLLAFWQAMQKTPGMMAIPNPEGATVLERHKKATEN